MKNILKTLFFVKIFYFVNIINGVLICSANIAMIPKINNVTAEAIVTAEANVTTEANVTMESYVTTEAIVAKETNVMIDYKVTADTHLRTGANATTEMYPIMEADVTMDSNVSMEMYVTRDIYDSPGSSYKIPQDCSQRDILKMQPSQSYESRLKKCCPFGEALLLENIEPDNKICYSTLHAFEPEIITAVLYDNCIEDDETITNLPLEITNPCNTSLLYRSEEDIFYVLQDGSLLILDAYANKSYTIEKNYCMDVDSYGKLVAFVCKSPIKEGVSRAHVILIASLMLLCIPFLIFTSYVHIVISEFRGLHGYIICSLSIFLAIGYCLFSIFVIMELKCVPIGYIIQFFFLAYFFMYFCLCLNLALLVWVIFPRKLQQSRCFNFALYIIYLSISLCGSITLVVLTAKKGYPGTPSYFLQGVTLSIRDSQQYFIPPISVLIFGCFLFQVIAFFGFKHLQTRIAVSSCSHTFSQNYENSKKQATIVALLGIVNASLWLMELVTFYSQERPSTFLWMDLLNSLHGVFIFGVFFVVPYSRLLISRWWIDNGTHNTEEVEMFFMPEANNKKGEIKS